MHNLFSLGNTTNINITNQTQLNTLTITKYTWIQLDLSTNIVGGIVHIYPRFLIFSLCPQYLPYMLACPNIVFILPVLAPKTGKSGNFDLMLASNIYLCQTTAKTSWQWKVFTLEWTHYSYLRLYWHNAPNNPFW